MEDGGWKTQEDMYIRAHRRHNRQGWRTEREGKGNGKGREVAEGQREARIYALALDLLWRVRTKESMRPFRLPM